MNTGTYGLPRWVLRELSAGAHPEVSAQGESMRWERSELSGSITYVFHVDGEKYTVCWFTSRGPEPA